MSVEGLLMLVEAYPLLAGYHVHRFFDYIMESIAGSRGVIPHIRYQLELFVAAARSASEFADRRGVGAIISQLTPIDHQIDGGAILHRRCRQVSVPVQAYSGLGRGGPPKCLDSLPG